MRRTSKSAVRANSSKARPTCWRRTQPSPSSRRTRPPKALTRSATMARLTDAKPLAVALEPWSGLGTHSARIAPEIVTYHQPDHPVAKQYSQLIEQMLHGLHGKTGHAMLLAGVRPNVGTRRC